jgi:polyadenylate-binding protein
LKAVSELHDKKFGDYTLYVREFLNKTEREVEKKKEQMRFKQSKKRCNLYVKNFPPTTTEQELREYFGKFGEIESVKIFSKQEGEAVYAFVCFKNPDNAAQAKANLHQ